MCDRAATGAAAPREGVWTRVRVGRGCWLHTALPGALLLACAGTLAAPDDGRTPIREVLGGASAGGFYQLLGETVAEMVRREYPGSSIAYEPGAQAGQLVRLMNGDIRLALQSQFELVYAVQGSKPFPHAYDPSQFALLARIVDKQHLLVFAARAFADRYRIRTVADLAARRAPVRMSLFQRGNAFADALVVRGIFGMSGVTEKNIRAWGGKVYYLPSNETARLMADRKLDVDTSASWHPDARTVHLARAVEVVPLPLGRRIVDQLARRYALEPDYVPAGAYDFLLEDYYTLSVPGYLVASPQLPEQEAYKITKALVAHFDYYQQAHPVFAKFRREMLPRTGGYALHPGARRLYREVGLLVR